MPKTTVQSLADELGLSKFAVSRALNNKPGVSEETRRKVREAAQRRGYRQGGSAPARQPQVCAIYAGEATGKRELWLEIRNGMEIEAVRLGVKLDLFPTTDPKEVRRLAEENQGVILIGPHSWEAFLAVEASGRPAVAVSPKLPALIKLNQITTPDAETGEAVAAHLLGMGHRDFVFVHGRAGLSSRSERLRGFRVVVEEVSGTKVKEMFLSDDYSSAEFCPLLLEMMHDGFRPTAFFCGADNVAVTVLGELKRLGLHIPRDCSVVGYGDYPLATQVTPQLTTVSAPMREEGLEAIRVMSRLLRKEEIWPSNCFARVTLVGSLVERGSTAKIGVPDWDRALLQGPSSMHRLPNSVVDF